MTEPEHQIMQTLHSGPKSFHELFGSLGDTLTATEIDRALWGLMDARKVVLLVAVGLYALGAE